MYIYYNIICIFGRSISFYCRLQGCISIHMDIIELDQLLVKHIRLEDLSCIGLSIIFHTNQYNFRDHPPYLPG